METINLVTDADIHIVAVGQQGPAGPPGPAGPAANIDDAAVSAGTTFSSQRIVALVDAAIGTTSSALTGFVSGAGAIAETDTILQGIQKLDGNVGLKQALTEKDTSGGYAGLTGFKLNLKNAAGTIVSGLASASTAERTWVMPDTSGTVALASDITGVNSGTNTGDETVETIKTKLGVTVLSGDNTGDQVLPTTLPASDVFAWAKATTKPGYTYSEVGAQAAGTYASGEGSAEGVNTGDETTATIKTKLGITTLSGANTGDETGATIKTKLGVPALSGSNTGDETATTIKTKLGIITLSGTNTGDNATNTQYSGLVSNATHTGDAAGNTVLTVSGINGVPLSDLGVGILKLTDGLPSKAALADFPTMTATLGGMVPTPPNDSTKFLRGDGVYATPPGAGGGTGDMMLADAQTVTGVKTFAAGSLLLRNAAGTYSAGFANTNTAARTYTFKDASGTVAFTSDITGTNSGTNTGDNATNTQYSGLVSNATHTGDATGATALTVVKINGVLLSGLGTGLLKLTAGVPSKAANADLPVMTATVGGAVPTPPNNSTTFLRGDGVFAEPVSAGFGAGDMVLADYQTVTGVKVFRDATFKLANVASTYTASFTNTITADRSYTLPNVSGTVALTSDITGTNSGTNTGDQTVASLGAQAALVSGVNIKAFGGASLVGSGEVALGMPTIRPTLNLNLAASRSLDPRVSFVRASVGTYFDALGVLRTAPANTPRFDFDPVTKVCKGLLVEESRTNLLTYSSALDNAAWSGAGVTATSGVLAPDGSLTACKLTESADTTNHARYMLKGVTASTAYSRSFFLKAGERTWAYIRQYDGPTNKGAWFDLANGVIGTVEAGITATMTPCGDGWHRCSVTCTTYASAASERAQVQVQRMDGETSYLGDGVSGIYAWGAQLEAGAFATSYVPTSAAAVTRAADAATLSGTNFAELIRQDEGTIVITADVLFVSAASGRVVSINDATTNNQIQLAFSAGTLAAYISTGAVGVFSKASAAPGANTPYTSSLAYKVNDCSASISGGLPTTDTAVPLPPVTQLQIGCGTSAYLNGHVSRLTYYPQRLDNTTLQLLSA